MSAHYIEVLKEKVVPSMASVNDEVKWEVNKSWPVKPKMMHNYLGIEWISISQLIFKPLSAMGDLRHHIIVNILCLGVK